MNILQERRLGALISEPSVAQKNVTGFGACPQQRQACFSGLGQWRVFVFYRNETQGADTMVGHSTESIQKQDGMFKSSGFHLGVILSLGDTG